MRGTDLSGALQSWPGTLSRSLAMTDEGIVCGAGSILARMAKDGGARKPALNADRGRLLALLSVAHRRPMTADILAPLEAAAGHWRRGDKALANLRLVFSGLPQLAEPADAYRMRLAEYLLDEGMAPAELMKELGLGPAGGGLGKYSPDQPRVPAGNGRRSGEWDFGGGVPTTTHGDNIVVAIEGDPNDHKTTIKEPGPVSVDGDEPSDGSHRGPQIDVLPGFPHGGVPPNILSEEAAPPLQRIHPDSTYERGIAKNSLDFLIGKSTEYIVESLSPTSQRPLRVTPDGRVYDGNTRIKILQERGYDINSLPRTKYQGE